MYIDVLLFDTADRRVLGRQILQSSLPMNAALTSLMVDEPLRVASWRRVSVSGPVLAVALGARLVPRSRVSRVSAVGSPRAWVRMWVRGARKGGGGPSAAYPTCHIIKDKLAPPEARTYASVAM